VSRLANALRDLSVGKGDFVSAYLPVIPQAIAAVLASAQIGAVHSVVFSGFSAKALAGRIEDCRSRVLITSDEGLRAGRRVPLKRNADAALGKLPFVEHVLVVRRTGADVPMTQGAAAGTMRLWSQRRLSANSPKSERRIRSSCSTPPAPRASPRACSTPRAAILSMRRQAFKAMLDYRPGDIHFCMADVGWITAHTYLIYRLLANGAAIVLFYTC
jgi:acetyl-CoA synthetase